MELGFMKKQLRSIALFLLLLFVFGSASLHADNVSRLHEALLRLDSLVEAKPSIHARHEAKLDSLKRLVAQTDDSWQQYMLYGSLFYEYLHYQADSSFYYVGKKEELLPLLNIPDLPNEILINRAEVYRVMGLRLETEELLKKVDRRQMNPGMLQYYYSVCCSHYTNMAEYVPGPYGGKEYARLAGCYRDSILQMLPDGVNHDLVFSEQLLQQADPQQVIKRLEKLLEQTEDGKSRTYLHYTLAEAYKMERDTTDMMYHLAQTAISDLQYAVREYAALQKLAWALYQQGDVKRAYSYAACSADDAMACFARMRMVESGTFYSIIQRTLDEERDKTHKATQRLLIAGSILFILLVVIVAGLAWWTKKMAEMRAELADMNGKLEGSNKELAMTGKIKEVYIAHYLDKCVNYMEQIEQYRRSLEKLAMSSKIEDLFKAIRSTDFLRDERKKFYAEFDRSFLELFPNFVEHFNELLLEGEEITVKPGELLCTELRIFALIRLGITDSNRIAHFLGYSLTTIYNYRSKLRNKAKGDKDTFEQRVMELCL